MSAISFDNVLGVHEAALHVRVQRNHLIANNIANAFTPGYQARDIDFKKTMESFVDDKSPERHSSNPIADDDVKYRVPLQPSLDDNSVEPHVEMAEFSKNNMEFLATLRFLNGSLNSMERALRGE